MRLTGRVKIMSYPFFVFPEFFVFNQTSKRKNLLTLQFCSVSAFDHFLFVFVFVWLWKMPKLFTDQFSHIKLARFSQLNELVLNIDLKWNYRRFGLFSLAKNSHETFLSPIKERKIYQLFPHRNYSVDGVKAFLLKRTAKRKDGLF